MTGTISRWLDHNSLYLALLAAWVAMLGSLYFSEVAGFVPCVLCWYQRILMYPLTLLLAVGLLRRDEHLPLLVLPLALVGLGIASYHYLLEKTDLFTTSAACQTGVSCTTVWINWLGFITIPLLSLVGFLTITLMCIIAWQAGEPQSSENAATPWLPVLGIVVVTLGAYVVLALQGRGTPATATPFIVLDVSDTLAQSRVIDGAVTPTLVEAAGEQVVRGARLYREACATCHGAQAEGVAGLGGPLAHAEFLHNHTDEELLHFIRAGRPADAPDNTSGLVMPPSGGRPDLTDPDLLAIIYYLRTGN